MKSYRSKYGIGDIVYLLTDPDQYPRLVVRVSFGNNYVDYTLAVGSLFSEHSEIEITPERNMEYTCSIN